MTKLQFSFDSADASLNITTFADNQRVELFPHAFTLKHKQRKLRFSFKKNIFVLPFGSILLTPVIKL